DVLGFAVDLIFQVEVVHQLAGAVNGAEAVALGEKGFGVRQGKDFGTAKKRLVLFGAEAHPGGHDGHGVVLGCGVEDVVDDAIPDVGHRLPLCPAGGEALGADRQHIVDQAGFIGGGVDGGG